jgi:hypothetical protein
MFYGVKLNSMTQQEIQERNKQIALMLGWKEATLEYKLKWCNVPTEEGLKRISQDFSVPILMKEKTYPLFNSSLRWLIDWNWLMEAVDFIEKLGFNTDSYSPVQGLVEDNFYEFNIWNKINPEIQGRGNTNKEAVFIAVSDFAHIFNNKEL